MKDLLKIAIVGAGNGGLNLTRFFHSMDNVELHLFDRNNSAPGMVFAREKGIPTSSSFAAMRNWQNGIVFEATGIDDVYEELKGLVSENVVVIKSEISSIFFTIIKSIINEIIELLDQNADKSNKAINTFAHSFKSILKNIDILAINASIEAARAGTAGKGFAVVANSIKDLVSESRTHMDSLEKIKSTMEEQKKVLAVRKEAMITEE